MNTITVIALMAVAFLLGAFLGVIIMGLCAASSMDDRETEEREAQESGEQ